jgi:hypothetical protein
LGGSEVGREANETDVRVVCSVCADAAIVREMISNADDFTGGGCFGVVDCGS